MRLEGDDAPNHRWLGPPPVLNGKVVAQGAKLEAKAADMAKAGGGGKKRAPASGGKKRAGGGKNKTTNAGKKSKSGALL